MHHDLVELARQRDAVDAVADRVAEETNLAEARLRDAAAATSEEAAVAVALSVAAFLRETAPWRLMELAARPEALALAPALLPSNVFRFARR